MPQHLFIGLLAVIAVGGIILWLIRRWDPNFRRIEEDDFLVAQAKIEAQAKLDRFVRLMQESPEDSYSVKVALPTPKGSEHIWVDSITVGSAEEEWSGLLANDPHDLKGMKLGSPVSFPQADIEDWMVIKEDGSYEGGFSVAALMGRV